jgi:hypothetical protein
LQQRRKAHAPVKPIITAEPVAMNHDAEIDTLRQMTPLVFEVGDKVFVESRTNPGMNKLGGAAIVTRVNTIVEDKNEPTTYDVKYVLGGIEKNLEAMYMRVLTEDSIKDSIKMTRDNNSENDNEEPEAPPPSMEDDYFDRVIWPNLYNLGWETVYIENSATKDVPPVGLEESRTKKWAGQDNLGNTRAGRFCVLYVPSRRLSACKK